MDDALHFVDGSRYVRPGQTGARETVCELCYGSGCKNGYRADGRMGYVTLWQHEMDILRGKDFVLFP